MAVQLQCGNALSCSLTFCLRCYNDTGYRSSTAASWHERMVPCYTPLLHPLPFLLLRMHLGICAYSPASLWLDQLLENPGNVPAIIDARMLPSLERFCTESCEHGRDVWYAQSARTWRRDRSRLGRVRRIGLTCRCRLHILYGLATSEVGSS